MGGNGRSSSVKDGSGIASVITFFSIRMSKRAEAIAPPANPVPAALISEVLVMGSSYFATMHDPASVVKYIVAQIREVELTAQLQRPPAAESSPMMVWATLLRSVPGNFAFDANGTALGSHSGGEVRSWRAALRKRVESRAKRCCRTVIMVARERRADGLKIDAVLKRKTRHHARSLPEECQAARPTRRFPPACRFGKPRPTL
jgi:hypothetical protein